MMADTYKVVSQRQTTDLTADGRFIDVMEVTFETLPGMHTGVVTIPVAQYTTDNVARIIAARAAVMNEIESL